MGAAEAVEIGLADAALPGDRARFDTAVIEHARALAALPEHAALARHEGRDPGSRRAAAATGAYRVRELAEMSHDIFDDRNGFAAARQRSSPSSAPRLGFRCRASRHTTASPCRWWRAWDEHSPLTEDPGLVPSS